MICDICGVKTKTKSQRIPSGWKRADRLYCCSCWNEAYTLKAITIPVVRPLGDGVGWPELREALRCAWSQSTACTNWMFSQLLTRDELRQPHHEKLAKLPKIYLYPDAREAFPNLPSRTVASLEQAIKRKYLKKRYNIVWLGSESLPSARYPQPFVAHNQAWSPSYESAGKSSGDPVPCVSVALLGKDRFLLQLRGGREFRRQLRDFDALVEERAIKGELCIMRKRVGGSGTDHGNGTAHRDSGGQTVHTRVMLKMVGWFPRIEKCQGGLLHLRTDAGCFLLALDNKSQRIRTWNADQLRRWNKEHQTRIQRWSEDQKCEQRPVASFQSRREMATRKYRNRIESFHKEIAAQVVGVCRRMRYGAVMLDTSCRTYMPRFDWSGFETVLFAKLNEYDIPLDVRAVE